MMIMVQGNGGLYAIRMRVIVRLVHLLPLSVAEYSYHMNVPPLGPLQQDQMHADISFDITLMELMVVSPLLPI